MFRDLAKRAINGALQPLGLKVHRIGMPPRGFDGFLASLKARGFMPATVIDVGVGHGTWPLYRHFSGAKHVLVEPVSAFNSDLDKIAAAYNCDIHRVAAGAKETTATIAVPRAIPQRATMLERELYVHDDSGHQERVDVRPLDDIADGYSGPFLVKIDAEGCELDIVRGASTVLRQTECLIAELSVAPIYRDGYHFLDVATLLNQYGLVFADVLEMEQYGPTGPLLHLDAAFISEHWLKPFTCD